MTEILTENIYTTSSTMERDNIIKLDFGAEKTSTVQDSLQKDISIYKSLNSYLYYMNLSNKKFSQKEFLGDDHMDKLLEKYIDKLDRDQSDLKNDIRESERRTFKSISDSEERISKKYDSISDQIKDLNSNVNGTYEKLENRININNKDIEEKYNRLEDKIDANNKYIISIAITTILAIAAMVITIILT